MSSLGKRKFSGGVALFPGLKANSVMNRIASTRSAKIFRRPRSMGMIEGVRKGVVVSGTNGPELKNLGFSIAAVAVDTNTPSVASLLSTLAEGTSLTQRVGGKIQVKSIDLIGNYIGTPNATSTIASAPAYCDVFLVWDKQPDGAVPSAATIFTLTTSNLTYGNIANTERFVVLRREHFHSSFNGDNAATWTWHVPMDCATKFPDATGSPNTNDFYVVALATNAAAGAAIISNSFQYYARVKFTDA